MRRWRGETEEKEKIEEEEGEEAPDAGGEEGGERLGGRRTLEDIWTCNNKFTSSS